MLSYAFHQLDMKNRLSTTLGIKTILALHLSIYKWFYYILMSLSVCSITGQPLKAPMASLKTGHLYEKEVI